MADKTNLLLVPLPYGRHGADLLFFSLWWYVSFLFTRICIHDVPTQVLTNSRHTAAQAAKETMK